MHEDRAPDGNRRPPFPGPGAFVRAARTLAPGVLLRGAPEEIDEAVLYYPLIGAIEGCVWFLADRLVRPLAGAPAAGLCVSVLSLAADHGRALAGLGLTLRSLRFAPDRAAVLAALGGPAPLVLCVLLFAAKVAVLCALDRLRIAGLLFAPLLAAWSMAVLAFASRQARPDGRRLKLAPRITFREFGWASAATFACIFGLSGFLGVLLAAAAALVTVGLRVVLHRWLDGLALIHLHAARELVQLLILGLLALA